jgi:Leucine-rich repeat (LRR) protein
VIQRRTNKQFLATIENRVIPKIKYLSDGMVDYLVTTSPPTDAMIQFTNLRALRIHNNDEYSINILHYFTNIRELDLRHLDIGDMGYTHIDKLVNLERFTPPIRGMRDTYVKGLSKINYLCLRDCKSFRGEVFTHLPNLTDLDLERNNTIGGKSLLVLTNLRRLNLTENRLVDDDTLIQLTSLVELELCDNQCITDKSLAYLSHLTRLVLLHGTLVTNNVLEKLRKLESLWININVREKRDMTRLSMLTTLTSLRVDAPLPNDTLSCLTNLTHLHIEDSGISILPSTFAVLTKLTKLTYTNDYPSDEYIDQG